MARKPRTSAKRSSCIKLSKNNKVHATNDKILINRVKQDIRRWQGRRDTSKIYIGKTSAPTGSISAANKAMKSRVDKTKKKMGTTDMKLLYITKSNTKINNAEKKLIDYNDRRPKKAGNRVGGGGGAPTGQPYKVLYAAVTKKGKGRCQRKRLGKS